MWAQGETVLLYVGSKPVSCAEFEYHFNRSPQVDKHAFLQHFIEFKLKAMDARARSLDTLSAYQQRRESFRKRIGTEVPASSGEREWIRLKHLSCPLGQQGSGMEERRAVQKLDSLYATLSPEQGLEGVGEELPWIQVRHLPAEWAEQVNRLERFEVSRPFLSPWGVHLIAWQEKKNAKNPSASERFPNGETQSLELLEDALLAFYWDENVGNRTTLSEKQLEDYFRQHRAEFGYGVPHYRGAVVHCRNKKEAKAIRKFLKKYPEALWKEAAMRIPPDVSSGCRIETGLFPIGKNPYVDKLAFGCGNFEPMDGYPYTWVTGKKLKKGPVDYRDVRPAVIEACRKEAKTALLQELERKYGVEVDKEVLKTVNRYGNR